MFSIIICVVKLFSKPNSHQDINFLRLWITDLRSVKYLNRETLDILYKLTVRSVIDYALPVIYKTLKQTELARLENL